MRNFLLRSGFKMSFVRGGTLTLLLILLTGFSYGASLFGDQTKNFVIKNKSLQQAIEQILEKSGYYVVYAVDNIKSLGTVTVEYSNITTEEALKNVLTSKGLTFTIKENNVVITKAPVEVQQPKSVNVKGRIIEKGTKRPIAGVTVIVLGTTKGAITDEKGQFNFTSNAGGIMEITFMGMKSQKVTISPSVAEYIIEMEQDAVAVDDVIITGIFNKAKESYTGAVSTVTAKDLKMFKGQNVLATLRNIDPSFNLVVDNKFGSDPNRLPEVNIRGNSSLPMTVKELNEGAKAQLNAPLVIMDGFEINLQKLMDFNDEEIESISILKDASATAIYGSRGANGVIVVTTKAPKEGKLTIYAQAGVNLEIADLSSYNLMNAREKLELERMVGNFNDDTDLGKDLKLKRKYNDQLSEVLKGVDTYWIGEPVRTGIGQKYNLRLEGGTKEFRWGASLSYNNIEGAMKGSSSDNFNGAITLSYSVGNVIFKNQTTIGFDKQTNSKYGSFSDYAKMNPYNRLKDEKGVLIKKYADDSYNPLCNAALNSKDESRYNEIINNFSIEWNIIPDLKLRGQIGISKILRRNDLFLPAEHSEFRDITSGDDLFRKGRYDYGSGEDFNYDISFNLNYNKVFNKLHAIYAGLDYSLAQRESFMFDFSGEGFSDERLDMIINALDYKNNSKPTGNEDLSRRMGLVGNFNYTYDNRYFIDLSFRVDGSSQFGSENKFAPFWSAGIGWNIHREAFLKGSKVINNLRLRGSYGQTGSQQFAAYQALSTFQYYTDKRYIIWNAAQLMGLGNSDLKWQVTDQVNGGIDLGLWGGRVTAGVDVYSKKTSNLLSQMDLPLANGFNSFADNVGEVVNSGFELMLGGYLIRDTQNEIMWSVNGKLAYNKSEIKKLSEAIKLQNEIAKSDGNVEINQLLYEGRSQNSLYAVPSLGIDPSTGNELFTNRYGEVVNKWDSRDKVYCGISDPKYRGNVSTMFSYKNLSLNLSFGYQWGGQQYNETLLKKVEVSKGVQMSGNLDKRVLTDRWQKAGDVKQFKGYDSGITKMSSRFILDDNSFSLQSASLQYRWSSKYLFEKLKLQTINFGVNMSDVFHISSIKRERGIEYPFARQISFTVSLLF